MSYCSKCEGKGGLCKYHLLIQFLTHITTDKYGKLETVETMMGHRKKLMKDDEEVERLDDHKIDEIFEQIDQDLSASI